MKKIYESAKIEMLSLNVKEDILVESPGKDYDGSDDTPWI